MGEFERLEAFCIEHGLVFTRWAEGCSGSWVTTRTVFAGYGEPRSYAASDDDRVLIDRATIERLGSVEAIIAYLDAAECPVPALAISPTDRLRG